MKGYYKMPGATAEAIDRQGWLHSGDLCCEDENGNFRVTGRLKDMIIRGGENIYPREIEEFIYTNPKVRDVQVIGVPDEQYGEEIMACIILKEGETMTEEELRGNLQYFLERMITVAAGCGVNMAIHEDDPCWSIFGLPRIITC